MVPTLMWGLLRSNFCLAISSFLRGETCLLLLLGDDRVGDRGRDFFVAVELHGERRAPLRHGPQVGRIAEHLRERDARADRLRPTDRLELLDPAAPTVQIT